MNYELKLKLTLILLIVSAAVLCLFGSPYDLMSNPVVVAQLNPSDTSYLQMRASLSGAHLVRLVTSWVDVIGLIIIWTSKGPTPKG